MTRPTEVAAEVGVVILNYNCGEILRECVASVLEQDYPNLSVWVVDNGSGDDSLKMMRETFPNVMLLPLGRNIGFAGLNIGIQQALGAGCAFVLYLDSDAKLHPTTVSVLVGYLKEHPTCGVAGPQQFRYETGKPYFLGSRLDLRTVRYSWIPSADVPIECDFVGNALIRSGILERVRFDERFFTYYADTDLCLRTRALGYTIVGVPQARIDSMRSYTSSLTPGLRGYIPARNRLLFVWKHTPRRFWPIAVALALFDSASRFAYWIIRGQFRNAAFVLIGLASGFLFLASGGEPEVWRDLVMNAMDNRIFLSDPKSGAP